MNYPVFFGLLSVLLTVSIVIGRFTSSKVNSSEDYFLSGRKLGFLPLTLIFLATQLGSGVILGCAQAAFSHGWYAIYYALGISIGLIILSLGLGAKFRKLNVATIPEIFTVVYDSTWLRSISAVILVLAMLVILLATGVATRKFFYALELNDIIFLSFWLAVILYTTAGGFKALAKTESLQISFVLITFIGVATAIFINNNTLNFAVTYSQQAYSAIPWSGWLIMPMLFTIIGQDMGQRCFAARTPSIVSKASIMAAILLSLSALLPIYLGISAANYNMPTTGASVLVNLVQQLVHPVVASFFACAILMAIISTADSLLCAVSANLTLDLFTKKYQLANKNIASIITAISGITIILLSYFVEQIIATMILAYSIAVCSLFVPLIMAVLGKKPNKTAAEITFVTGILSYLLLYNLSISYAEIISIILSYIVYIIISFIFNKKNHVSITADIIPRSQHNVSRARMSRNVVQVLYKLANSGYQAFLVGGAVRDLALIGSPKDFDVATNATPDQVRKVFRNCRIIGRRFKLAHVYFGKEIIEVATFRGSDRRDNLTSTVGMILRDNVYGTIEQDALRRDFTINALYYNIQDFSIVDYVGGITDLNNKTIRIIGDPSERYREDPLRMLRAIRFASKLNFAIHELTSAPIFDQSELLTHVPTARLYDEFLKLFLSGHALSSFNNLQQYSLLKYILPQTESSLKNNNFNKLITIVLTNTDDRVLSKQTVAPAFLLAALLWQAFINQYSFLVKSGKNSNESLFEAANHVLQQQRQQFSIPRYIAEAVKELWILQERLSRSVKNSNRARRLKNNVKFRAAYDFLMLRSQAGEQQAKNLVKQWKKYI